VMDRMWKTIDSLEQKGLISSALEEVRKIRQSALQGNDSGHLVKAIMHEYKYLNQLEEDSAIKALERIEKEVETFPEPARSVMHSLIAEWYGQYLQGHLWELRNRTEFSGTPGPDIRTWGIRHFIDQIQDHFASSIRWEGLKTAKVEDYTLLLTEKQNTDELRPTLYDILMHRALDFYAGAESFLTKPVYDFVLTYPAAFSPARTFVDHNFPAQDSLSNTWLALQWYQDLLKFRLADANHESALVDADLKRLRFAYDHIVNESKDSLYKTALDKLSLSHMDHPESALVDYYRAELLSQLATEWQNNKDSRHRYAYNEALKICQAANAKFPNAYGSQLCQGLIKQIQHKNLSAVMEEVNLPNEELLVQVEYRNLSSVYLKLVKLPNAPRRWRNDIRTGEDLLAKLLSLPAIKTWEQKISDGDDYQPHLTEIPLQALPFGHYALLVSDMTDMDNKTSHTGALTFTISELGHWLINDRTNSNTATIFNRKSGQPLSGVKAEFYTYQYSNGRQRQDEVKLGEATSDANGFVTIPAKENQSVSIQLSKGNDELFEDEYYHVYRYGFDYDANPTTLFFADRSIYRPGQKIYFKGYALDFDRNQVPRIVSRKNVEVVFYDANGQEQMRKNFISNDYGTFAGHFDLPQGGLTGQMSIGSNHGANRHYFQVEEYKRPKFEIKFDTLKEVVRLNDDVTIRGFAKDYAGSAVPNANVRYRVERVSYRPWWYGYYRKGFWPREEDRQVLAVGTTTTKNDGSFTVTFDAKPKAGGDPNLMYRFETTAFITDITGESHELTKSINVNSQGYEVNIAIPQRISKDDLKNISVVAQNSDGADVRLNGDLEVTQLKGPASNKRERLWTVPDILTISENEYATRFINYHIPGKETMDKWDTEKSIGKKAIELNGRDSIDLSSLIREAGYYKLTWKWKDAAGKILDINLFVMVYDESQKLPGQEIIEVAFDNKKYEPGQEVEVDLLTGLSSPPKTFRILERRSTEPARKWFDLPNYNDKSISITENDRGGIHLHHLTAYNNRYVHTQNLIQVPWSNKDLLVELKTWRDKMEPGDEETWTMTVKGPKQEAVTSEMLLSMYDASLDAFIPHEWKMNLYPSTQSKVFVQGSSKTAEFNILTQYWENQTDAPSRQYRDINVYGYYPEGGYGGYYRRYKNDRDMAADGRVTMGVEVQSAAPQAATLEESANKGGGDQKEAETPKPQVAPTPPPLRTALEETVFFLPQINTDNKGNLTFSFKMKEGLTRWKFQALAHTKDLAFGLTQAEAVTQKQLMVFPNPPRFFREGDTIAFQIKATNLTSQIQTGTAQLKIIDALTNQDVSSQWKIQSTSKDLKIDASGTAPLSWTVEVPRKWTTPVKYQVSASAGAFTDGEEAMLPVVTNRILITETLPLPLKAKETRTFVFKSMQANSSSTIDHHRYTVEMTTSPAWYAVQALPYLMEYPHECAEQVFNRLYANTLASHIAVKYPAIKQTYETWRNTNDDALLSNL
ncbi:MAG: alpha-2-macroglobulin family protein, partial [Saprospiraceae bacterium]